MKLNWNFWRGTCRLGRGGGGLKKFPSMGGVRGKEIFSGTTHSAVLFNSIYSDHKRIYKTATVDNNYCCMFSMNAFTKPRVPI